MLYGGVTVSAIQDLAPYIESYQGAIKCAKDAQGYTIQRLVDESGVSYSAVAKLMNNTQANPTLFNSIAICMVLGLSVDALFGLEKPVDAEAQAKQRIHELELENVRLTAANNMMAAQLAAHKPIIYGLLAVSALLLCAVIGYIVFDIQLKNIGLFQSAGMSILAVFLCIIVLAAVSVAVLAVKTIVKEAKHPQP